MKAEAYIFRQLFDKETSTYTYLVADCLSREAALIDPVLENLDRDLKLVDELGFKLKYSIETHVHADHVTSAFLIREKTSAQTVINKNAQVECASVFINDGDILKLGNLEIKAIFTPGHTNTCTSFIFEDMVFTGDCLFIRGTGRTNFQQGSAASMYESIVDELYTLPDDTKIYPGHDYKGLTSSTIKEEKLFNPRLNYLTSKRDFMETMNNLKFDQPKNIHIAVPANLLCGRSKNND
jgi:glyoxylase-like metal-dependent hydrolase (beta-lactamase superfamily II)